MRLIYYALTLTILITAAACGGNSDGGESPTYASKAYAPQLIDPEEHGEGVGWKSDRCFYCHSIADVSDIHSYSSSLAASLSSTYETDIGVCLYCHGTNGIAGVTADTYRCTWCHENSNLVSSSAGILSGHNTHDLDGDGEIRNSDCIVCHEFSDMDGTIDLGLDLRQAGEAYENTSEFCLRCHDSNGALGVLPPDIIFDEDFNNSSFAPLK